MPNHPLLLLHKLNIMDKHRVVPIVGAVFGNLTVTATTMEGRVIRMTGGATSETFDIHGPLEDGAVALRWMILAPSKGKLKFKTTHETQVVFDKAGPGQGKPVVPALAEMLASALGILTYFAAQ